MWFSLLCYASVYFCASLSVACTAHTGTHTQIIPSLLSQHSAIKPRIFCYYFLGGNHFWKICLFYFSKCEQSKQSQCKISSKSDASKSMRCEWQDMNTYIYICIYILFFFTRQMKKQQQQNNVRINKWMESERVGVMERGKKWCTERWMKPGEWKKVKIMAEEKKGKKSSGW